MYPSIYSNHGVYEEDFFKPHPPEKIWSIFENIGVSMPEEVFQEVWKEAAQRNSKKEARPNYNNIIIITIMITIIIIGECGIVQICAGGDTN